MAKVINFPVQQSTGFKNLKGFFEVVTSFETCDFYLAVAEEMRASGKITENEFLTLRRIGRQKRFSLMTD